MAKLDPDELHTQFISLRYNQVSTFDSWFSIGLISDNFFFFDIESTKDMYTSSVPHPVTEMTQMVRFIFELSDTMLQHDRAVYSFMMLLGDYGGI